MASKGIGARWARGVVLALGVAVGLGAAGCASKSDLTQAYAQKLKSEADCRESTCECEERCHVKVMGCEYREDVCETGLQGCLLACSGELGDGYPEVVF